MISTNKLLGYGTYGLTGAAVCAALYFGVKLYKLAKTFKKAIKNVEEMTEVEVADYVIKEATDKAVEAAVASRAKRVADDVSSDMQKQIKMQVSDAIREAKSEIKSNVTSEAKRQISEMSISDLRKEIKEEAKEHIMNRLSSDMDDILATYNKQLENVGKIYDSMADFMTGKKATEAAKNINLNLG